MSTRHKSKLPGNIQSIIDRTKHEIAAELGVHLGADATARENGKVGGQFGGQITKQLVAKALQDMSDDES
ncbi:MAG: alpha/beta-type small acid-soluble spore protein [Defluviitaleaceae bacterium]|nr:alpha/beta-type small acid-soluble spore protein [Defluviitaleaceae bacterium]